MRIMLSSLEGGAQKVACKNNMTRFRAIQNGISDTPLLWNLMSYYYLRTDVEFAVTVRDMRDLVMIDSGAHSFQKGAKVKWDEYTHAYAAFIREFDRPNKPQALFGGLYLCLLLYGILYTTSKEACMATAAQAKATTKYRRA